LANGRSDGYASARSPKARRTGWQRARAMHYSIVDFMVEYDQPCMACTGA
jgi:hypothetical protein